MSRVVGGRKGGVLPGDFIAAPTGISVTKALRGRIVPTKNVES